MIHFLIYPALLYSKLKLHKQIMNSLIILLEKLLKK